MRGVEIIFTEPQMNEQRFLQNVRLHPLGVEMAPEGAMNRVRTSRKWGADGNLTLKKEELRKCNRPHHGSRPSYRWEPGSA